MEFERNDLRLSEFQRVYLSIPEWAKAEHMEMSTHEIELWIHGRMINSPQNLKTLIKKLRIFNLLEDSEK